MSDGDVALEKGGGAGAGVRHRVVKVKGKCIYIAHFL